MECAMTPSARFSYAGTVNDKGAPSLVLAAICIVALHPAYRSAHSWISLSTYRLHCFDVVRWVTATVNQQVGLQSAMRVRCEI